jgi:L-rhamnose isomerase/sugar isomerase
LAYAQALIVDQKALEQAREENDVTKAQDILQESYRSDLRPLISEARLRSGGVIDPIGAYRKAGIRETLITERGLKTVATGL